MLNLKKALAGRGENNVTLAEKIGITPMAVGQMVNGNPTVNTLNRIAEALGCDVVELFDQPAHLATTCSCPYCGKLLHLGIKVS